MRIHYATASVPVSIPFPLALLATEKCWPQAASDAERMHAAVINPVNGGHGFRDIRFMSYDRFDPQAWAARGIKISE